MVAAATVAAKVEDEVFTARLKELRGFLLNPLLCRHIATTRRQAQKIGLFIHQAGHWLWRIVTYKFTIVGVTLLLECPEGVSRAVGVAVEVLIEPEGVVGNGLVSRLLAAHKLFQVCISHRLVFSLEAALHQHRENGVVLLVHIDGIVVGLVGLADGIGLNAISFLELIVHVAREVLRHRSLTAAKHLLEVLGQTATVPNRDNRTAIVVKHGHRNGLIVNPIDEIGALLRINRIVAQILTGSIVTRYVGIRKLLIGSKGYRSVVAKDDVLVFLRTVDPVLGSGDIILLPTTQLPCAMQAVLLLQVLHCQHVECSLNPVGRVLHQLIDLVDIGVAGEEMLVEGAAVVEPTQGEGAVGGADNLYALILRLRELARKM